jgi:hypothetical protein
MPIRKNLDAVPVPVGELVQEEGVPVVAPGAPVVAPGTGDWEAAMQAVRELEDYDFDAYQKLREYDLRHAKDHLP